jgi:transcription elongation GreA/GreB family factor
MPTTDLMKLAQKDNLDGFESRFMAALEEGGLDLAQLAPPFRQLEGSKERERVATLGQMALENLDVESDPAATLDVARVALVADPKNEGLRTRVAALYHTVHGDKPGFDRLMASAGLETGRPARNAVRVLQTALTIAKGDALVSRTEDSVVEVMDVDLESGLFTVRRAGRPNTMSALDLAREFEPIGSSDFRVVRQLHPERIGELLDSDPIAVILGLLRAHDDLLKQDELKRELVPRHLDAGKWSKWWTRARAAMRQCPNIIVEGRSPVVLTYCAQGRTSEDELWEAFEGARDQADWLGLIEAYLREKRSHKELPDSDALQKLADHVDAYADGLGDKRLREAFHCALVRERLGALMDPDGDSGARPAVEMLRAAAADAASLIEGIHDSAMWGLALDALESAFGEGAGEHAVSLIGIAPATHLDRILKIVADAELVAAAQSYVEMAAADPIEYPEMAYWLWKGPAEVPGLELPSDDALFAANLQTLSSIGRTLHPGPEVAKRFRHRIKAALSLRSFGKVRECLERVSRARAITIRRQIEWLEGMGDTVKGKLIGIMRELHSELWLKPVVRVEPWEDEGVLWGTRAGIERKQSELDELVNVQMRENAKRIGEAASHGDLSENSEYKFALEERDFLRARVAQASQQLALAVPIEARDVPTDHTGIGTRVVVRNTTTSAEQSLTFLGPFDTDPDHGLYNYKAPMCQLLLGLHVGDVAHVTLSDVEADYEIVSIACGVDPGN